MISFGKGHFVVVKKSGTGAVAVSEYMQQAEAHERAAHLQEDNPSEEYAVTELVYRWNAKHNSYYV